jgi:lipoprotein NlpD
MSRAGMWGVVALVATLVLPGCTSKGRLAPVDDLSAGGVRSSSRFVPGSDNAGKPGYYTVKPRDTLLRISMDHGQAMRDVVRWNNLSDPNAIEVGQVLRVAPPQQPVVAAVAPVNAASAAAPLKPSDAAPMPAVQEPIDDGVNFQWPSKGKLLSGFDESKNKGLDIAGKAGDPVLAAADGRVVYAGNSLRGYGNLIIVKHNNTYLTAYAHNQSLLVKEDQTIKRGQKIAEMGNTDADQVKLHFEIRRQGKPVDPAKYLPAH